MSDDAIESFNVKGLEQLIKALKVKPPVARVGILGDGLRQTTEGGKSQPTNAEVGAAHEFGSEKRNLKPRSFLRVPISDGLQKEMERRGLLDKDKMAEVIREGALLPWMEEVAICAEACGADAFATQGNGKWPAWVDKNYENNTGMILVDTHQLRDSITSDVK